MCLFGESTVSLSNYCDHYGHLCCHEAYTTYIAWIPVCLCIHIMNYSSWRNCSFSFVFLFLLVGPRLHCTSSFSYGFWRIKPDSYTTLRISKVIKFPHFLICINFMTIADSRKVKKSFNFVTLQKKEYLIIRRENLENIFNYWIIKILI